MSEAKQTQPISIDRRGLMLVLSSPSGAGKSSIARQILQDDNIELSVSVTTRSRRPSEIDGTHYHFMDQKQFAKMQKNDELLEWAEVHGNYYGTPKEPVEDALSKGKDVLFDIDWQGTKQLHEKVPTDLVRIFILPPSIKELKMRLERRAEDSSDVIRQRLENAKLEIEQWPEYDYLIVNEDLQKSTENVASILAAERMRRDRQVGMKMFTAGLFDQLAEIARD